MTATLDQRYGRTRRSRRRDVWIAVIMGVAFVVVFAAWVIWAGLDGAKPTVDAQDTKHSIIDAHTVSVSFEVTMAPGTTASCAVQALNESFSIVGVEGGRHPRRLDLHARLHGGSAHLRPEQHRFGQGLLADLVLVIRPDVTVGALSYLEEYR